MDERKKAKLLKDFALSMLSGIENFIDNDCNFEELLDWLEIDATHIMKRIETFREEV